LPGVAAGEHANGLRSKLVLAPDPSETNSPNSPDSPHRSSDSTPAVTNSPDEILIASCTYHTSGEFGEFHPAVPESREEISLRVVTTEPSEPADQPSADVQVSPDVENDIQLETPIDHVIREFIEAQPEAWKRAHLVCRDDRQHGYVVGFTAPALNTLVQYVTTQAVFGSEAERDYYAASLRWCID